MNANPGYQRSPATAIQWPSKRARSWLNSLPARFPGIRAIIIVGSRARGFARPESDLDVVIVFDGERPRDRPPPELDLRWVSSADLTERVLGGDEFVGWGVVYGVTLFDSGVWASTVAALRNRVPLPSVTLARQRASQAEHDARRLLSSGDVDAAAEQTLTLLTHHARALLVIHSVFPASRPELPAQLRAVGETQLASLLSDALADKVSPQEALERAQFLRTR